MNQNSESETRALGNLEDDETQQLIAYLRQIKKVSNDMALDGINGAHEIYCMSRNALDLMVADQVSREMMRRLQGVEPLQTMSQEVTNYLLQNRFIDAIKQLRSEKGLGLKEAKDAVEAYRDELRRNGQLTY